MDFTSSQNRGAMQSNPSGAPTPAKSLQEMSAMIHDGTAMIAQKIANIIDRLDGAPGKPSPADQRPIYPIPNSLAMAINNAEGAEKLLSVLELKIFG